MRGSAPRVSLAVQYAVAETTLPVPAKLRRWARAALDRDATVTLRFVGRREGQTLNAVYRGKDCATNVLAFVYDEPAPIAGDIVLCVPVLRQEARAQGKPLADHCAHLVIHGILHLQGYDHDNARAARAMEARETAILATLGVPNPYAVARAMSLTGRPEREYRSAQHAGTAPVSATGRPEREYRSAQHAGTAPVSATGRPERELRPLGGQRSAASRKRGGTHP